MTKVKKLALVGVLVTMIFGLLFAAGIITTMSTYIIALVFFIIFMSILVS